MYVLPKVRAALVFPEIFVVRYILTARFPTKTTWIMQDRVAEVENTLHGYASKDLLKISGPDFDTIL
jgi:hypothetical protein